MKKLLNFLFPTSQKGNSIINSIFSNNSRIDHSSHNENHEIIHQYEMEASKFAHQGSTDGSYGIPAADFVGHCHAEEEIIHSHAKAKEHLHLATEKNRQKITNHLTEKKEKLTNQESEEHRKSRLEQAQREAHHKASNKVTCVTKDLKLWWMIRMQKTVDGVLSTLKEHHRHAKEEKAHLDAQHHHLLHHHYHQIPPLKRLIDYIFIFYFTVGLLFLMEIGSNFSAFKAIGLGDINLISLVIGIGLALGQAISAKELGFAHFRKQRIRTGLFLIITFVLCTIISTARWGMEGSLFLKLTLISINFLIAIATTILAHSHAKHHDYFLAVRLRKKKSAQIQKIEHQMMAIETDYEKRKIDEQWKVIHKTRREEKEHTESLKREIRQNESQLQELVTQEQHNLQKLNAIKHDALARYRELNQKARQASNHQIVNHWLHQGKKKGNNNTSSINKVAGFLLVILVGLSSCNTPVEPTHIEVIYDQTGITKSQDIHLMADYILSHALNNHHKESWGEVHIHLSSISELSTPIVRHLELPASKGHLMRKELEHKQHISQFKKALVMELEGLTHPSLAMNHSYIHRNIYYRLHDLAKKKGHRIVLVWSDLILNHPPVDFYHYTENPSGIITDKDSLIHLMTDGYSLHDVTGIKLVNIHTSEKKFDALHESSKHFFEHYWTSKGIEVKFLTTIPHHHPVADVHDESEASLH